MGMILAERTEYIDKKSSVSYATRIASKLKKAGDFLLTYTPIMWLLFFSLLVLVIKLVES